MHLYNAYIYIYTYVILYSLKMLYIYIISSHLYIHGLPLNGDFPSLQLPSWSPASCCAPTVKDKLGEEAWRKAGKS